MKTITMTEEEYVERSESYEGVCMACGEDAYDVEPDARAYECDSCGEHRVYGLEELLTMGCIQFEEDL